MSKLKLTTTDHITISGIYTKINSDTAVILVHMLNRSKEDWNNLTNALNNANFTTLMIDMRGHGESDGNWQQFSDDDFKKITLDISAAKDYLTQHKHTTVYIIGASIGANAALRFSADDPTITKIVLLSPGENYHGVTTFDAAPRSTGNVLVITSKDDPQSYSASQRIAHLAPRAQTILYEKGGHGTTLLTTQPELEEKIIRFLKN